MNYIFFTLLFLVPGLSYAQVYKWVDEAGRTHYSQIPPTVKQPQSMQKMTTRGALLKREPHKNGYDYFCGSLFLLSEKGGDAVLHENIQLSLHGWEQQRNQQQAYVVKLQATKMPQNPKQLTLAEEKLSRYECRVNWAYAKLKELNSYSYKAKKTNQQLEQRYKELEAFRDKECPADGERYGGMLVGDAARAWRKCYEGYSSEMRSIRKKIAENRRLARETQR